MDTRRKKAADKGHAPNTGHNSSNLGGPYRATPGVSPFRDNSGYEDRDKNTSYAYYNETRVFKKTLSHWTVMLKYKNDEISKRGVNLSWRDLLTWKLAEKS